MRRIRYKSERYWAWKRGYDKFIEVNDEFTLAKLRSENAFAEMERILGRCLKRVEMRFGHVGIPAKLEEAYEEMTKAEGLRYNMLETVYIDNLRKKNKLKPLRTQYYRFVPNHMKTEGYFRRAALQIGTQWEEP